MTVQYSSDVFTSTGTHGLFLKLLLRWRGSIYKLIWRDLLIYISFYFFLSGLYRFVLDQPHREKFESVALYCNSFADLIPVTFVLGFYVSLVIQRWWSQFELLPWPDSASVWISTCIHGNDDRGRLMRRTIVRYLNLTLILTLRLISLPVKKRFPTLDHLLEAGILLDNEKKILEQMDLLSLSHPKYWMPLVWAGSIVTRARKEDRVKNDYALKALIEKLDQYRMLNGGLLNYDYVNIPMVYTQVVTLAVYTFLLSTLMGRQFLDVDKKYKGHEVDLYFPIFTFLQFFFYMGWLKVAEALINPFGEDDDDFDVNWLIDRNLQVSYLIVDEMHQEHPELIKDQFWEEAFPELPYTAAAEDFRIDPVIGAAAGIEVEEKEAEFLPLDDSHIVVNDHGYSSSVEHKENLLHDTLEGIIIEVGTEDEKEEDDDNASLKARGNGSNLLPKNQSTISFRTSHGSTSTLAKDGSKLNALSNFGSRMANVLGSTMGSQLSLFNKKTRPQLRRRRGLGRSNSRLSNSSAGSQITTSPRVKVEPGFLHGRKLEDDDDNEDNISSSMTSINTPDGDAPSVYHSRMDVTLSRMNSRAGDVKRGSVINVAAECGGSSIGEQALQLHNKQLRKKLEDIQKIHDEILHQLDTEIEDHEHRVFKGGAAAALSGTDTVSGDTADLVHALELKTQLLKHQLKRRNKRRRRTDSNGSSPPPSLNQQSSDLLSTDDGASGSDVRTAIQEESTDDSNKDDKPEVENKTGAETKESATNGTKASPTDDKDDTDGSECEDITKDPDAEEPKDESKPDQGEEEEENSDEVSYEPDLSTIDEIPEAGYQSDTNDTDAASKIDVKKKGQPSGLPTLKEEES